MPNWCNNGVRLVAPNKELMDALVASIDGDAEEKFFNFLRPRPKSEDEEGGDWYNWNCNNWGSKWDANPDVVHREDDKTVFLSFESAWSPPTALYQYLSENGWKVEAHYYEPGMGFVGKYVDGFDECFELNFGDESSLDGIPEELLEYFNIREEFQDWKEANDEDDE